MVTYETHDYHKRTRLKLKPKLITDFCKNNNIKLDEIVLDEGISGSGEKTDKRNGYNSVD